MKTLKDLEAEYQAHNAAIALKGDRKRKLLQEVEELDTELEKHEQAKRNILIKIGENHAS